MKKKKTIKLNDLSQLGSVISFRQNKPFESSVDINKPFEIKEPDLKQERGNFINNGETVEWVKDEINGKWIMLK